MRYNQLIRLIIFRLIPLLLHIFSTHSYYLTCAAFSTYTRLLLLLNFTSAYRSYTLSHASRIVTASRPFNIHYSTKTIILLHAPLLQSIAFVNYSSLPQYSLSTNNILYSYSISAILTCLKSGDINTAARHFDIISPSHKLELYKWYRTSNDPDMYHYFATIFASSNYVYHSINRILPLSIHFADTLPQTHTIVSYIVPSSSSIESPSEAIVFYDLETLHNPTLTSSSPQKTIRIGNILTYLLSFVCVGSRSTSNVITTLVIKDDIDVTAWLSNIIISNINCSVRTLFIIAHNQSRFDGPIIFRSLLALSISDNLTLRSTIHNNLFYRISLSNTNSKTGPTLVFQCSLRLLLIGLDRASKTYLDTSSGKLSFAHSYPTARASIHIASPRSISVQFSTNPSQTRFLLSYITANYPNLYRYAHLYCEIDVALLHGVYSVFKASFHKVFGYSSSNTPCITAPSLSLSAYLLIYHSTSICTLPTDSEIHSIAYPGYGGGRCEVLLGFNSSKSLVEVHDLSSQYGTIICESLPVGPPVLLHNINNSLTPDALMHYLFHNDLTALLHCTVDVPYSINVPILGVFAKSAPSSGNKYIFPTGRIEGSWHVSELMLAINNKCRIVFVHSVIVQSLGTPLASFGSKLLERKYALSDPSSHSSVAGTAELAVVKIILNALYGKFGQNLLITSKVVPAGTTSTDLLVYDQSHIPLTEFNFVEFVSLGSTKFANLLLSSTISSKGRCKLWLAVRAIITNCPGSSIIYTDTDSLFFNNPTKTALLCPNLFSSTSYTPQPWLVQEVYTSAVFFAPKQYQLESVSKTSLKAFNKIKGTPAGTRKAIMFPLIERGFISRYRLPLPGINVWKVADLSAIQINNIQKLSNPLYSSKRNMVYSSLALWSSESLPIPLSGTTYPPADKLGTLNSILSISIHYSPTVCLRQRLWFLLSLSGVSSISTSPSPSHDLSLRLLCGSIVTLTRGATSDTLLVAHFAHLLAPSSSSVVPSSSELVCKESIFAVLLWLFLSNPYYYKMGIVVSRSATYLPAPLPLFFHPPAYYFSLGSTSFWSYVDAALTTILEQYSSTPLLATADPLNPDVPLLGFKFLKLPIITA
jgi:hypothetical protein